MNNKYYSSHFSCFGQNKFVSFNSHNNMSIMSNGSLKLHIAQFRKLLYDHAAMALEKGAPPSTTFNICMTILDLKTMETKIFTFHKTLFFIFKNFED